MTAQLRPLPTAAPRLSVVIATYNRRALLERLLRQFARQTLDAKLFEVVVVDDGSKEPVKEPLEGLAQELPYKLRVEVQQNAGAAAARHRGVMLARAEILLITDDDMQVGDDFLQRHLEAHEGGEHRVVLGRIRADPSIHDMPLFERWYARKQDKVAEGVARGTHKLRGNSLLTGNVSLRKADYLGVGGFDLSLGHSEDFELGLRLEKAGVEFCYSQEAQVFHGSDHTQTEMFLRRARKYGVFDSRISHKHPDLANASPWQYLFRINPVAAPLLVSSLLFPEATRPVSDAALAAAQAADKAGIDKLAHGGIAVVYAMEYFRGVRQEAGSLRKAATDFAGYLQKRWRNR
jgi:glycosyltransferase involved in cell wall biosynthesis